MVIAEGADVIQRGDRAETERLRKDTREQKRLRLLRFLEEAQSYGVHNLYFGIRTTNTCMRKMK